ncbi:Putative sugar transporter, major facilitator transporter Str1/Tri12, MFS transporter superfamily [Septoria linicola]|uniref:Sugar transporter, major facilitator transporter Str1/Tri12, MFS transporter superfamily n=1 Tax=Septoria linicola TaxID=215465 RepID=A0A9Q9AR90_9PEZI|nr:putative sugar transporter, major facilitator transporter Str1/Tri12, MFS transporter superfamily [Septoria linicola]USW53959.1 Putative sugar transporter, major facilitator transporter Str1/Tri12, MFS transporter superfamily [Septoria linicola]
MESKDEILPEVVVALEDLVSARRNSSEALRHDHIAPEAKGEDLPKGYYWSPSFIGTLAATCLAQISGYSGWVLPANTISLIVAELGPSEHAIWLAVSYQAGLSVGFLLIGRLSDIFGRRWLFTGCSMLAVVGNIVGSTARSVDVVIVCNSINGLAASGQLSFSVVLGELVPNKNRGVYNAIVQATGIPFSVFGPVIMRAFFQHTELTFRWCYIIGVIINTIAVVLYYFFYRPPNYSLLHAGGKPWAQQLKSFDWIGSLLFIFGLLVLLIGLNWAGGTYSWSDAHVLGAFFAGITTLVAFCVWEAHCPHEYPLMPMRLFLNYEYDAILICAAVAAMLYFCGVILWPGLIQSLFTTSVSRIGWLSCVVGGGTIFGQILAGVGVRYIPRMKLQMIFAGAVMMAFTASIASAKPGTEARTTAFMLIGTAAGGYIDNLTLSTMALVWKPDDIGLVAGVLALLRTVTGAIVTSMYSSILMTEDRKYLGRYVPSAVVQAGLSEESIPAVLAGIQTGNFSAVPGITPTATVIIGAASQKATMMAMRTVFLCTIPFGAIFREEAAECETEVFDSAT